MNKRLNLKTTLKAKLKLLKNDQHIVILKSDGLPTLIILHMFVMIILCGRRL